MCLCVCVLRACLPCHPSDEGAVLGRSRRHPDGSPVAPSDLPGRTPLDIRLGLTRPEGVAHNLRWGILGSAKIGEDWARALADVPGASVVAVAARSAASAEKFAAKLGIPKSYGGKRDPLCLALCFPLCLALCLALSHAVSLSLPNGLSSQATSTSRMTLTST